VLRLAHRGDGRAAPENTLDAFAAALAVAGCDGVEFDVRTSADGVPVVIHDETLDRVQGRPGRVDEHRAAELETVGVPSLRAVLAAIPHRAFLDIELKGLHDRTVVEIIAAGRGPSLVNAAISSFEPATLERVGRLVPDWPRWLNTEDLAADTIARAVELGCRAISVDHAAIDADSVARARRAGLDVAAWTVVDVATYGRLQRLGVVAACVESAALDGA
jgi:glycerophosphoryl diester phosphodiesterase